MTKTNIFKFICYFDIRCQGAGYKDCTQKRSEILKLKYAFQFQGITMLRRICQRDLELQICQEEEFIFHKQNIHIHKRFHWFENT